jgi:hypothetical protein
MPDFQRVTNVIVKHRLGNEPKFSKEYTHCSVTIENITQNGEPALEITVAELKHEFATNLIEPMMALPVRDLPAGDWLYEMKRREMALAGKEVVE